MGSSGTYVSIIAGTGLTGGGSLITDRTVNVSGGTGITANANDIELSWTNTQNDGEIVSYDGGNPNRLTVAEYINPDFYWDGNMLPKQDGVWDLGRPGNCWREVWALAFNTCGIFEQNLAGTNQEENNNHELGTVMVWKDGELVPCSSNKDHMRMGVMVPDKNIPIVQGAEPVLVFGIVKEGDYLVTSEKEGHAKAISREEMINEKLHDVVFAKALEDGEGDSYVINAYINI